MSKLVAIKWSEADPKYSFIVPIPFWSDGMIDIFVAVAARMNKLARVINTPTRTQRSLWTNDYIWVLWPSHPIFIPISVGFYLPLKLKISFIISLWPLSTCWCFSIKNIGHYFVCIDELLIQISCWISIWKITGN